MIAERRAALADHDIVAAARGLGLGHDLPHVLGRQELPLLDVHRLAAGGDGLDEIGLPAQECRRLQHIDYGGHRRDLVHRVHIGQHRHVALPPHFLEDAQALLHARSAKRRVRAAVGLVVGRLEDERHVERRANRLEFAGDIHLQLARLDDTGTGDQEQRPVQPDVEAAQLHGL